MTYTFMDFCAWIGCWRLWLEKAWFECVWFSEIDPKPSQTYRHFYWEEEKNHWDLMKIDTSELPNFDLLIAWFPCQTFSVIGQRKWLWDPRGQVIFGIDKILREKNVKFFILENVKGLVNHDKWNTIKEIEKLLDQSWYYVSWKVLNTIDYWLPQSRERVYFIGIRKDLAPFETKYVFPEKVHRKSLKAFLIEESDDFVFSEKRTDTMKRYLNNKYNQWKYTINDLLEKDGFIIDTRQSDIRFYHWFSPTLRTWRHGLVYVKNGKLREISWLESLLLQWIPYEIAMKAIWRTSNKDLLWQAGNAMSVDVIEWLGTSLMNFILSNNLLDESTRHDWSMIENSKRLISEWIWCDRKVQQLA